MLPAGATGGANMGVASGTIQLDTSQLALAVQTARSLAQSLQHAMNQAGNGSTRANNGFAQMAANLRSVNTELLAIGAGAGLLTKLGLDGAMSLRNYNIAFRQFVGSQKEAEALTNRLIAAANKYGLEWEGTVQLGRALLPSLKEGAKDLDAWVSRAARLRSLFPTAPRGSETIAISEFLSGQNTSIQRRFNIPASLIQEATSKFQDLGQAMDYILERRGATEEAAVAMANAFVGVRNELTLLLAQGFTPLFQALQPVLKSLRDFLTMLRDTQPGAVTAGAGLIALAAAGAPALLLFNQLVSAAEKLKALGVLGGLGRLGVAGAAVGVGAVAGVGIVNAAGAVTGNKDWQETSLSSTWLKLRKLFAEMVLALAQVIHVVTNGVVNALRSFTNALISAVGTLGSVVSEIGNMLPGRLGGSAISQAGTLLTASVGPLQQQNDLMFDKLLADMNKRKNRYAQLFRDFILPPGTASTPADSGGPMVGSGGGPDIAGPVADWAKAVQRIEREAGEARLQATQDYERQRSETIAQYELSALREAEDFARQRARQEANYQRQLAQVQEDAAKREAIWQRDFSEKLADLRSDSNQRLAELEEDYAKDRERRERDHRSRLLDAAGRLDAIAVADEQRRYTEQEQDAKENYDDQRTKIQAALDERIADELKAHQRRLEDQRTADAERLADMKQAFEEQRAEEDFDRAIRLQRQAEDHASQLAQMDVAQAERLAQIDRQAAQERAAVDENFLEQLHVAGVYRQAWLDQQKAQQEASLKLFDAWWETIKARFPDAAPAASFPTSFADYGYTSSGVMAPVAKATTGGSVSSSITIAEGAIQIYPSAGMDERAVARQVRTEMERLLVEAAR